MRVIVDMPDDLVKRLDLAAGRSDRSRAWIIRNACAVWVQETPAPTPGHGYLPNRGNALKCSICGGKLADH